MVDLDNLSASELMKNLTDSGMEKETAMAMVILVKIRIHLEKTIQETETDADGDICWQPGTLSLEETQKLILVQKDISYLERIISEDPKKTNPFDLISLKEARAQAANLLAYEKVPPGGDIIPFEDAKNLYREAASTARRHGWHFEATRILELMGKTSVTSALAIVTTWPTEREQGITMPRDKPLKSALLEALDVFKEALIPLANISPKNFYQFALRSDRVKTAAILFENVAPETIATDKKYLPIIREIVEQDLRYITDNWAQLAKNNMDCYYWVYSIALIDLAKTLNAKHGTGINIPDCPLATSEAAEKAKKFSQYLDSRPHTTANTNEVVAAEKARKDRIIDACLAQPA